MQIRRIRGTRPINLTGYQRLMHSWLALSVSVYLHKMILLWALVKDMHTYFNDSNNKKKQ
jgi:hypothetical protein